MARAHPQEARSCVSAVEVRSRSRMPRSGGRDCGRRKREIRKVLSPQVHQPEDELRGCIRSAAASRNSYCSSSVGNALRMERRTPSDRGRSRRRCRATRLVRELVHVRQQRSVVPSSVTEERRPGGATPLRELRSAASDRTRRSIDSPGLTKRSSHAIDDEPIAVLIFLDAEAPGDARRASAPGNRAVGKSVASSRITNARTYRAPGARSSGQELLGDTIAPRGFSDRRDLLAPRARRATASHVGMSAASRADGRPARPPGSWCTRRRLPTPLLRR